MKPTFDVKWLRDTMTKHSSWSRVCLSQTSLRLLARLEKLPLVLSLDEVAISTFQTLADTLFSIDRDYAYVNQGGNPSPMVQCEIRKRLNEMVQYSLQAFLPLIRQEGKAELESVVGVTVLASLVMDYVLPDKATWTDIEIHQGGHDVFIITQRPWLCEHNTTFALYRCVCIALGIELDSSWALADSNNNKLCQSTGFFIPKLIRQERCVYFQ